MADDPTPKSPDFDGFLDKLRRIVDRTPKGGDLDDDDGAEGNSRTIPYAKFYRTNQRMKAAEAALQAMQADFGDLRTGAAAEIDRIKAAAADQAAQLQGRHRPGRRWPRRRRPGRPARVPERPT